MGGLWRHQTRAGEPPLRGSCLSTSPSRPCRVWHTPNGKTGISRKKSLGRGGVGRAVKMAHEAINVRVCEKHAPAAVSREPHLVKDLALVLVLVRTVAIHVRASCFSTCEASHGNSHRLDVGRGVVLQTGKKNGLSFFIPRGVRCVDMQRTTSARMLLTHIAVEGNIGSGKSEILRRLHGRGYATIHEPVDMWRTWLGVDWLGAFLQHRTAYHATMLQLVVLVSYVTMTLPWWGVCVVERSVLSSVLVFCKQNLDDAAYRLMIGIHRAFCSHSNPHAIIYVRTSPDVCLQRLKERDRQGEVVSYTISYIRKLHAQHERAIATHPLCCAVVNGDLPPDQVAAEVSRIVSRHSRRVHARWWCVGLLVAMTMLVCYPMIQWAREDCNMGCKRRVFVSEGAETTHWR